MTFYVLPPLNEAPRRQFRRVSDLRALNAGYLVSSDFVARMTVGEIQRLLNNAESLSRRADALDRRASPG